MIEIKKLREAEKMMRQQEKVQRQEQMRVEREMRAQQMVEVRVGAPPGRYRTRWEVSGFHQEQTRA